MDIAKRSSHNPLMRPQDLKPCIPGMEITCLLNPGVFRMNGKTWLVLRVAERPVQKEGVISFPIYNKEGKIVIARNGCTTRITLKCTSHSGMKCITLKKVDC